MNPRPHLKSALLSGKWLLLPFYFGLIAAQALYCLKYTTATVELYLNFASLDEAKIMLAVLNTIDMTMIATLITMIVKSGYTSFVDGSGETDNSGALKVKMACVLIAVSSIHLMQVFLSTASISNRELIIKAALHCLFLTSALALAVIDYLHSKSAHHENHHIQAPH